MQTDPDKERESIDLPEPTAWPIVAATGLTLLLFGLVTNLVVSLVGFLLGVAGAVGWCLDLFPHPKHEAVPLRPMAERPAKVVPTNRVVQILDMGHIPSRARVPLKVHPYTAGILGGLAGAVAMAVLACVWGAFRYSSIWYPINLLAAAGVPSLATDNLETLRAFSATGFIVGIIAHLTISVLVGLLYVVLLPMLPKRQWFWGGIITPLIWSAFIYLSLSLINPTLARGIDWPWFVVCQVAYGAVCGFVVFKSTNVATMQHWSLARKLGVEAQHKSEDEK